MRTLSLSLLLLLLPAYGGPGASPVSVRAGAPRGEGSGLALEEALGRADAEKIRSDLHFIASDQLAGRDTPSSGLRIAARFLRARLERLGFGPGAPDGYFWVYHLERRRLDEARTGAALVAGGAEHALRFGTDYAFSSRGLEDRSVRGPLVWIAGGSEEDLAGLDLAGRVALCEASGGAGAFRAGRRAREAGALGIVYVPARGATEEAFGDAFGAWVESCRAGRVRLAAPEAEAEEAPAGDEFASLTLSRAAAGRLWALADAQSAPRPGTELAVSVVDERRVELASAPIPVENVCGFWPGSDPELGREVILVTAHYDHVGVSGEDIYNGADDNGSGTCALLALAEVLAARGPLARSVMLMWVSGEEKGLYGSRAWSLSPWLPDGRRAVLDINVDMVGRNAPGELYVTPSKDHERYNGLVRLAEELAPLEGFPELRGADQYYSRSDHAMFAENMGLPVCFFFSGDHEDYHRPTDTPDKVDTDKVRRVTRLVARMLEGLQSPELGL